jgi:hypothetical protein
VEGVAIGTCWNEPDLASTARFYELLVAWYRVGSAELTSDLVKTAMAGL